MSISFSDSLKKITKESKVATAELSQMAAAIDIDSNESSPSIMTLEEGSGVPAYSGEDGDWLQHDSYRCYPSFSDDNISIIDDKKNISLSDNQLNVAQEENSQYIPFEMPRYYDGFDLIETSISIHYETSNKKHGFSVPINVTYNDEKIRFGWLVDSNATKSVGRLKFEVHAVGEVYDIDGNSTKYVWKTKYNEELTVAQSLCGIGADDIEDEDEEITFEEIADSEIDALFVR